MDQVQTQTRNDTIHSYIDSYQRIIGITRIPIGTLLADAACGGRGSETIFSSNFMVPPVPIKQPILTTSEYDVSYFISSQLT